MNFKYYTHQNLLQELSINAYILHLAVLTYVQLK